MSSTLIDTAAGMTTLLDSLATVPNSPPALFLDLEGVDLGRNGTISIIQAFVQPLNHVYLIDIHVLGATAFSTPSSTGPTLKSILESADVPKVFFDVRSDSDALFSHFHIQLAGVQDIQLMENAGRPSQRRRYLNGLAKCIEQDTSMTSAQRSRWRLVKETGKKLFAPEKGGSYQVWNERPLTQELAEYCVQDVLLLPELRNRYSGRLSEIWAQRVRAETLARVSKSQSVGYNGHGQHMALGPWP